MAYVPHHHAAGSGSRGRVVKNALGFIVLAGGFFGSVYAFRRHAADRVAERPAETDVARATVAAAEIPAATARLADVENGGGSGEATRGGKDGRWHVAVRAALPAIDRQTTSYEAWLVSRLPFDFISLGEMTTDEAGTFVTEWVGDTGKAYPTYAKVLITRQTKSNDADPGIHVVEGVFTP